MFNRKQNYLKQDRTQSKEERMRRLKHELREHIRFLSDFELLSVDWFRLTESLNQIANVAFMEMHLPASQQNPLLQQGKKDQGTLWDQEKDELAVRILLEEGKLNLLMRMLHNYKITQRSRKLEELKQKATEDFSCDLATVDSRCNVFEESIGVLLKYALKHVEALQILDLPELLTHCREVLEDDARLARYMGENDEKLEDVKDAQQRVQGEKSQSKLVLQYLYCVSVHLEALDEDRMMDLIDERKLIPLVVEHIHSQYHSIRVDTLRNICLFLANVMSSDAFLTEPERFVVGDRLTHHLLECQGLFVEELVINHGLVRKDIRPLLDVFSKLERQYGKPNVKPLPLMVASMTANAESNKHELDEQSRHKNQQFDDMNNDNNNNNNNDNNNDANDNNQQNENAVISAGLSRSTSKKTILSPDRAASIISGQNAPM